MQEPSSDRPDPGELLVAIRSQVAEEEDRLGRPTIYLSSQEVRRLAGPDASVEDYTKRLITQHRESRAIAEYMDRTPSAEGFAVATDVLNDWVDSTLPTPSYTGGHLDRWQVDHITIARSLILNSARLIEEHPDDADLLLEKVLPFFDRTRDPAHYEYLTRYMHTFADRFASFTAMQRAEIPGHERGAIRILSEATAAGHLPVKFWYDRGVRSSHGQLPFAMVEGIYDQVVVRGTDIRPARVDARQLWEDIPNFCTEIIGSLAHDPTRHKQNVKQITEWLDKQRGKGSKSLPPTTIIKLANVITAKINGTERQFGADYDESGVAGPRELLPEMTFIRLAKRCAACFTLRVTLRQMPRWLDGKVIKMIFIWDQSRGS